VKGSCRRVVDMGQPMILLLFLSRVYNGLSDDRILFDLIYASRFTEDNRVTTGQRG
jgi:hypothetical protein